MRIAALVVCCLLAVVCVDAFYEPGVTPHTYKKDERLKVRVNKLTSTKTM
jgi:hypothetical protein